MSHFGTKNDAWSKFCICSKDFFKFYLVKEAKRYIKFIGTFFLKKISLRAIGTFWAQK